jgi:hypothetical protein
LRRSSNDGRFRPTQNTTSPIQPGFRKRFYAAANTRAAKLIRQPPGSLGQYLFRMGAIVSRPTVDLNRDFCAIGRRHNACSVRSTTGPRLTAIAAGVHQTWWREFFKRFYPFTPPDLSPLEISITLKTVQTLVQNQLNLTPKRDRLT